MTVFPPPRFAAIPAAIAKRQQWVLWKYETPGPGRDPGKVPYSPWGMRASSTDPGTWSTLKLCSSTYRAGGYDGLMYACAADDPFVFVDLDHCRDAQTGELASWAAAIVTELATYAETSPRGEGVHLYGRAALVGDHHKRGDVEIYWQGRFACVTGARLEGTPAAIADVQAPLERLYASIAPPPRPAAAVVDPEKQDLQRLSDTEVIARASSCAYGPKFAALYRGDAAAYYPDASADGADASAADLALCGYLAFWCSNDTAQMDRLFRASGLYRAKWDERHGGGTYGQKTLARAVSTTVYDPERYRTGDEACPPEDRPGDARDARIAELTEKLLAAEEAIRLEHVARAAAELDAAQVRFRLEELQAEPMAERALRMERRALTAEGRIEQVYGVIEQPDIRATSRLMACEDMYRFNLWRPVPLFGETPPPPERVTINPKEAELRIGVKPGSHSTHVAPAIAKNILTMEIRHPRVKLAGKRVGIRTDVIMSAGSGAPTPDWQVLRRRMEDSKKGKVKEARLKKIVRLHEATPTLERAKERAQEPSPCGAMLLPTAYFCPSCEAVLAPDDVAKLPVLVVTEKRQPQHASCLHALLGDHFTQRPDAQHVPRSAPGVVDPDFRDLQDSSGDDSCTQWFSTEDGAAAREGGRVVDPENRSPIPTKRSLPKNGVYKLPGDAAPVWGPANDMPF